MAEQLDLRVLRAVVFLLLYVWVEEDGAEGQDADGSDRGRDQDRQHRQRQDLLTRL